MARIITLLLMVSMILLSGACGPAPEEETAPPAARAEPAPAWTVGIYAGPTPFDLSEPEGVSNPVLTAADVTDFDADIVAHPFMVIENDEYYLFFTAKYGPDDAGGIGLATSQDGFNWEYQKMVIREPFVQSYPYVFKWQDDYFMIPEAHTETSTRLYRATAFPLEWAYEKDLISGETLISASVAFYGDTWWMFVAPEGNRTLRLFYASDLTGEWTEHPLSPIIEDNPDIARPGGRVLVYDGSLYRMGQDCDPTYGNQVHAFRITEISPIAYTEEMIEPPVVRADSTGWNSRAMHHVDPHQMKDGTWIAAVDALGIVP